MRFTRSILILTLLAALCGAAMTALTIIPAATPAAHAAPRAAITASPEPDPPSSPVPDTPVLDTPVPDTPVPRDEDNGRADPALAKSVEPADPHVGDEVVFTLTVTNHGDRRARDVVVTDPVPPLFEVLEAHADRGDLEVSGNTVVARIGTVAPGEVIRISIRARVTGDAPAASNSAELTTSNGDRDVSNNAATVTLALATAPPTATPTVEPTPAATETPTPPSVAQQEADQSASSSADAPRQRLPRTATPLADGDLWLLAALGLAGIALGVWARRRQAATR